MRNHIKQKRNHPWLPVLVVICLLVCSALPAFAAGTVSTSDTFTLSIQCSFSNGEDNVQENHEENLFLILDTKLNLYVVASVDPEAGYRVTGYTADQDSATKFTPANCSSQVGKLIIQNLPASTYSISQIQTLEVYMMLKDPICLDIFQSSDNSFCATVDGYEVDSSDGLIEFQITNSISFHLPMCPCAECQLRSIRMYSPIYLGPILIVVSLILLFVVLKKKHK